jgi:hypothetical protein
MQSLYRLWFESAWQLKLLCAFVGIYCSKCMILIVRCFSQYPRVLFPSPYNAESVRLRVKQSNLGEMHLEMLT